MTNIDVRALALRRLYVEDFLGLIFAARRQRVAYATVAGVGCVGIGLSRGRNSASRNINVETTANCRGLDVSRFFLRAALFLLGLFFAFEYKLWLSVSV